MIKFLCFTGIPYPLYQSYKKTVEGISSESNDHILDYWTVFGILCLIAIFFEDIITWLPFSKELLFFFIIYLQIYPKLCQTINHKYFKAVVEPYIPLIDTWINRIKFNPAILIVVPIHLIMTFYQQSAKSVNTLKYLTLKRQKNNAIKPSNSTESESESKTLPSQYITLVIKNNKK